MSYRPYPPPVKRPYPSPRMLEIAKTYGFNGDNAERLEKIMYRRDLVILRHVREVTMRRSRIGH